jgi:hypothetical protein
MRDDDLRRDLLARAKRVVLSAPPAPWMPFSGEPQPLYGGTTYRATLCHDWPPRDHLPHTDPDE